MENKKSGLITGIIIGFLIAVIAFLAVYIILDKKDNDKTTDDNKQTEENVKDDKKDDVIAESYTAKLPVTCSTRSADDGSVIDTYGVTSGTVDIDASKYSNIFEYIAEQDDVQVVVSYYKESSDFVISGDYEQAEYTLTEDEKKTFINNMKNSSLALKEKYLGGALTSTIYIKYKRDGKDHIINIYQSTSLVCATDINIFKIADENLTAEDSNANNYIFSNFDNTIYDLVDNEN